MKNESKKKINKLVIMTRREKEKSKRSKNFKRKKLQKKKEKKFKRKKRDRRKKGNVGVIKMANLEEKMKQNRGKK